MQEVKITTNTLCASLTQSKINTKIGNTTLEKIYIIFLSRKHRIRQEYSQFCLKRRHVREKPAINKQNRKRNGIHT